MQSIFPLSWCTDRLAPKMQPGKAGLDNMRSAPAVEIPVLNRLKRKRTNSPEPLSPLQLQPNKKQRADGEAVGSLPRSCFPPKSAPDAVFTHAPSSAYKATAPRPAAPPHSGIVLPQPATQRPVMEKHKRRADSHVMLQRPEDLPMHDAQFSTAATPTDLTPLQHVIENEFSMQILTKHNELRLIEQELAKCQIALEQLRRCELRPYPGSEHPVESVCAGVGPAITPPSGYTQPTYSAPHGVTDGPYSRHYRHWLLHDPMFDAVPVPVQTPTDIAHSAAYRPTRLSGTARKSIGRASAVPARGLDAMHSIPNYPVTGPKDKSAPLVLRRSTDGQLVKLICNNCQRGNFSSIQGFLNHCRIAHKVDYKSHDAAAVDCGRPLEEHEAAHLPPEIQHAPPPKPTANRSSSVVSTPLKNLVHPMNVVGGVSVTPRVPSRPSARSAQVPKPAPISSGRQSSQTSGSSFKPSAQAPRLSAHFAKYNLGGDLDQAIADAKQKVDLGADEEIASPELFGPMSPSAPWAGSRTVAGAAGSRPGVLAPPGGFGRPSSRKGHREPTPRHRPAPLVPDPGHQPGSGLKQEQQHGGEIPESPQDHSSTLSPHTADSNPGLVSDHEDDDHGSASEDEVPHRTAAAAPGTGMPHPLTTVGRNSCTDNMEIDVAVDDDMDEHGVVIRRNSMLAAEDRDIAATTAAGGSSRKLSVRGHEGD